MVKILSVCIKLDLKGQVIGNGLDDPFELAWYMQRASPDSASASPALCAWPHLPAAAVAARWTAAQLD